MVHIDSFFNSGAGDLGQEVNDDIEVGLLTEKRTQFYYRSYGVGLFDYENRPNLSVLSVLIKYSVMAYMSFRNSMVTSGFNGTRDLRAATSQSVIEVSPLRGEDGGKDLLDVKVPYVRLSDLNANSVASVRIDA